jgi:purine nucleoside phosphorylase
MKEPYNIQLLKKAEKIALENNIRTRTGVYIFVPGPSQTTRSELNMLTLLGAGSIS